MQLGTTQPQTYEEAKELIRKDEYGVNIEFVNNSEIRFVSNSIIFNKIKAYLQYALNMIR